MSDVQVRKISDFATKVGSGSTPKGGEANYKSEGVPLIRSMNVHFDGFRYDGLAFLDDDQASSLKNVEVCAGDVLLNITGASIGRVTVAPEKLRLAPKIMKALILDMCTERWLSAKEIAEVLNRDPQKIQARFLTMMVRESLLELRHPGVPNRPDQAYRTAKK